MLNGRLTLHNAKAGAVLARQGDQVQLCPATILNFPYPTLNIVAYEEYRQRSDDDDDDAILFCLLSYLFQILFGLIGCQFALCPVRLSARLPTND